MNAERNDRGQANPEAESAPAGACADPALPAIDALHDHPAKSSVRPKWEFHYSPSTQEMLLWCDAYPFEKLEQWLINHPDSILCEPERNYPQDRYRTNQHYNSD